jgi:hypothetical protein
MIDPIQAFLQANALETPVFPATSRYHGIGVSVFTRADGSQVAYLRRRFVPAPERFSTLYEVHVDAATRVELLAAQHLGDPEQYYRLCDANGAMQPSELCQPLGRSLRITLPEGIPGAPVDNG